MRFFCIVVAACSAWIGVSASSYASSKTITVAIVDDAFDISSPLLKGMLWQNESEVANNGKDDDGNGLIDDKFGWDVSDLDSDISAPSARINEFTHGTGMAKIIATSIRETLGERQDYPIKLMLVKAISDSAAHLNLVDGYDGLEYAISNKADVVNLSWGGGIPTKSDIQKLALAEKNNTLVIASLGTYPQRDASMPAAHRAVIGVAGVNNDRLLYSSNFGDEADVAALAQISIEGEEMEGVSVSTALVTATMALMKLKTPSASKNQLLHCLQLTAEPLDKNNPARAGQMGAGLINKSEALNCIESINVQAANLNPVLLKQPEGSLMHRHRGKPKQAKQSWIVDPQGRYQGLELKPYVEGKPKKSKLEIRNNTDDQQVIWSGLLSDLPPSISTNASNIRVDLNADSSSKFSFNAKYATQNIIFSDVFCRGKQEIIFDQTSEPYILEDGSGALDYAGESDCKWLFQPAKGFDLKFEFLEFDTELHVDGLHLFRGDTTSQTNFLMKVTGAESPPAVLVERDPVLLWFTSDLPHSHRGFKLRVSQIASKRSHQ